MRDAPGEVHYIRSDGGYRRSGGCTGVRLYLSCRVAAIEARAAGTNYTFAPCIAVPRDDRWGRVLEGFAETPDLTKVMARASVLGFQTTDLSHPSAIAACAKHFAGDGGTAYGTGTTGILDRGNTKGDDATLRAIHLPGYAAAVRAGCASVMASFSSWNGVRMHGNKTLVTDWLKAGEGFDGFINGDWDGHLVGIIGANDVEKTRNCILAGVDVPMGTSNPEIATLKNAIDGMYGNGGGARVDDAVKRLLRIKYRMGLFDGGSVMSNSQAAALVGSQPHRDLAREAVRKSLVLLKTSTGLLPISKTAKVTLVGAHCQNIGLQCGGWTISWLGSAGNITPGTTIRQGFEAMAGAGAISWSADGTVIPGDIAVVFIGEKPYAEWHGDTASLAVAGADLVTNAKKSEKKTIVVLISGRPMDISSVIGDCDAFVAAWLPGTEGGGIAEVLYGAYDFTGKLSFTWPKNTAQEPINYGDANYQPLYEYDYGLKLDGTLLPKKLYRQPSRYKGMAPCLPLTKGIRGKAPPIRRLPISLKTALQRK